jgi:hypothetical protein
MQLGVFCAPTNGIKDAERSSLAVKCEVEIFQAFKSAGAVERVQDVLTVA